jgi:hypothetical protein
MRYSNLTRFGQRLGGSSEAFFLSWTSGVGGGGGSGNSKWKLSRSMSMH